MRFLALKFVKAMELRSAKMLHYIQEFTEQYNREHHDLIKVQVELHGVGKDWLFANLYDDINIKQTRVGEEHQVLRLVNSNFKRFLDKMKAVVDLEEKSKEADLEGMIESEKYRKAMLDLFDFFGERDQLDRTLIYHISQFKKILDIANERMNGPMKWFNGATCNSLAGMVGISDYKRRLEEDREFLIREGEYYFGVECLDYLEKIQNKGLQEV